MTYDGFITVMSGQSPTLAVYLVLILAAVYVLLFLMGKKIELFSKAIIRFSEYSKKYGITVFFVFLIILFNIAGSEALDKGIRKAERLLSSNRPNTHEVHFSGSSRKPVKGRLVRVSPTLYGFLDYENGAALLINHGIIDIVKAENSSLEIKSNKVNTADVKSRAASFNHGFHSGSGGQQYLLENL